jgi:hypothetical protein
VATDIPKGLTGRDRDGIWLALFLRFFMLVLDVRPSARNIEFVFDKKRDIELHARRAYDKLTGPLRSLVPNSYLRGHDVRRGPRRARVAGVGLADIRVAEELDEPPLSAGSR